MNEIKDSHIKTLNLENKFYEYLSNNHPKVPDWYRTIAKDLATIAESNIKYLDRKKVIEIVYREIDFNDYSGIIGREEVVNQICDLAISVKE